MPAAGFSWVESFRVRSYELGPGGELAVASLCNYLQEAAGCHAAARGASIPELMRDGLTWVLARLKLVVETFPGWCDEVVVETWPSRMRGFVAQREFLVRSDERILARATSSWFVIDLERRRPVRLPQRLDELPVPDRERALDSGYSALPRLAHPRWQRIFRVGYDDLDINRHLNHVRYLEWAIDTLPEEFREAHRLAELTVDFQAEINLAAEVRSAAKLDDDGSQAVVLHSLSLDDGATEAARLRTHWRRQTG